MKDKGHRAAPIGGSSSHEQVYIHEQIHVPANMCV
jgi:hypothetical protein